MTVSNRPNLPSLFPHSFSPRGDQIGTAYQLQRHQEGVIEAVRTGRLTMVPPLTEQALTDLGLRWLSMSIDQLYEELMTKTADGTSSPKAEAIENFKDLPPDLAAQIVNKLVRPDQSSTEAYKSAQILMEFVDAAGETPAFNQIFPPETIEAANTLFTEHAAKFFALSNVATRHGAVQGSLPKFIRLHLVGLSPQHVIDVDLDEVYRSTLRETSGHTQSAQHRAREIMSDPRSSLTWFMQNKPEEARRLFPRTKGMNREQTSAYAGRIVSMSRSEHADFGRITTKFADQVATAQYRSKGIREQLQKAADSNGNSGPRTNRGQTPGNSGGAHSTNSSHEDVSTSQDKAAWKPIEGAKNMSLFELQKQIILMLSSTEEARKRSMEQLVGAEAEPDQATLTGFKANMDRLQGRMDVLSQIIKDSSDHQKSLAHKLLG